MSDIVFSGVTYAEIVDADNNPTRVAAEVLGVVFSGLRDAVKAFTRAKAGLMAGTLTPAAFAAAARAFGDVTVEAREVLRSIPLKTTARGGATPQTVWCEYFEGVDARLERNMTRTDAKAKNKRSFS